MQLINMYNISLKRYSYSTSAHVCCIKIHAKLKDLLQVKDWSFYIHCCHCFLIPFLCSLIKYLYYLTHKSYKIVDNKSKTTLIRYTHKNISLMKINSIILVLRTRMILLSSFVIYIFSVYVISYYIPSTLSSESQRNSKYYDPE